MPQGLSSSSSRKNQHQVTADPRAQGTAPLGLLLSSAMHGEGDQTPYPAVWPDFLQTSVSPKTQRRAPISQGCCCLNFIRISNRHKTEAHIGHDGSHRPAYPVPSHGTSTSLYLHTALYRSGEHFPDIPTLHY